MSTIDVLIAGRAEVEKWWAQGIDNVSTLPGTPVCASYACWRVAPFCQWEEAYNALQALLPIRVPAWNDLPSTTKADVLALFDRAIAVESQKATVNPDPAHTFATVA